MCLCRPEKTLWNWFTIQTIAAFAVVEDCEAGLIVRDKIECWIKEQFIQCMPYKYKSPFETKWNWMWTTSMHLSNGKSSPFWSAGTRTSGE